MRLPNLLILSAAFRKRPSGRTRALQIMRPRLHLPGRNVVSLFKLTTRNVNACVRVTQHFMPLFVVANWISNTCSCERALCALKKGFAVVAGPPLLPAPCVYTQTHKHTHNCVCGCGLRRQMQELLALMSQLCQNLGCKLLQQEYSS